MRFRIFTSLLAIAVFLQSPVVNAEVIKQHECERDSVIRTVELQADGESGLPCRILYHRAMEDKPTINLWNANNNAQFCANKYDSFIVKLENKLNWSCEAIRTADQPLKDSVATPQMTNAIPDSQKVSEGNRRDTSRADDASTENAKPIPGNEVPASIPLPAPARALPDFQPAQDAESPLSMNRIRQYFPSGQYLSHAKNSGDDNASLCPAGGFFIWNTKTPDKPIFEMGPDLEFQFDLSEAAYQPVTSALRGVVLNRCSTKVSTGYCSNDEYTGDQALHPALSAYYECGGRTVNSQNHRPLVLVRTLVELDSSSPGCAISESYHYMSLAPVSSTGESRDFTGGHEIELVIMPKQSNSGSLQSNNAAVCRYRLGD